MTRIEFEKFAENAQINKWWDSGSSDIQEFLAALYKFSDLCYNAGHREGMRKGREQRPVDERI
jgi:hypothetical protein